MKPSTPGSHATASRSVSTMHLLGGGALAIVVCLKVMMSLSLPVHLVLDGLALVAFGASRGRATSGAFVSSWRMYLFGIAYHLALGVLVGGAARPAADAMVLSGGPQVPAVTVVPWELAGIGLSLTVWIWAGAGIGCIWVGALGGTGWKKSLRENLWVLGVFFLWGFSWSDSIVMGVRDLAEAARGFEPLAVVTSLLSSSWGSTTWCAGRYEGRTRRQASLLCRFEPPWRGGV